MGMGGAIIDYFCSTFSPMSLLSTIRCRIFHWAVQRDAEVCAFHASHLIRANSKIYFHFATKFTLVQIRLLGLLHLSLFLRHNRNIVKAPGFRSVCVVSYSEQIYRLNLKVPHKQPGFNLEYFANNVLKVCEKVLCIHYSSSDVGFSCAAE